MEEKEDKMGKKSIIVCMMEIWEKLPRTLIELLRTALDIWNEK